MDLKTQLKAERLASYHRLRGGFPIPLAGATYWAFLGVLGYFVPPEYWSPIAFITSGMIFPLALMFAKLFGNTFMKDTNAVGDVIFPAFVSMLLFWPMAVAAYWTDNQLTPLMLAIGMSIHWPVIGWSYGRPAPFIAHAIVRAMGVFAIWQFMPEARFTALPLFVAGVYLATVLILWVDSGRSRAAVHDAQRK